MAVRPDFRLAALATDRRNNVLLVRFMAAAAVIVFHSYALTGRLVDEPLHQWMPELALGIVGVDAFFFLSGLLVTKSWCERQHLPSFLAARALRIYPALVAAVLFSIAVGLAVTTVPVREFLADPMTVEYLWRNASAWSARYTLPGVFEDNPFPKGVNGSLWTLPIEVRLYLLLAVAGAVGLLTRRGAWMVVATLLAAAALWAPTLPGFEPDDRGTRRLLAMFALGSVAWTWRAAIPVSLAGGAATLVLLVADPFSVIRSTPLVGVALGYLIVVLAFHPWLRVPGLGRVGDYSYGLYVYAFPIQQTIVHLQRDIGPTALTLAAVPLTLALAAGSWHLIEKPALAWKPAIR